MSNITEADKGIIEQWYNDARNQRTDTVAEFITRLMNDYEHDYGTVCHALAACAIAAASSADKEEQGGITGFQAGAVMWQFIQKWMHEDGPMRLVKYDKMLYPQYEDDFDKTLSGHTWEWLQNKAGEKLQDPGGAHPAVAAHWQSIVDGTVPFSYRVEG
jgi:hypothetical protein